MPLTTIANVSDILVPPRRQRSEITPKDLAETKESIAKHGLFHAPVVVKREESEGPLFQLVIGGRRLRAITELYKAHPTFSFRYGDTTVQNNLIPVTVISGRSLAQLMQMELDENIQRVDIPWQDRVQALTDIHKQLELEAAEEGRKQTVANTAAVIHEKLGGSEAPIKESTVQQQFKRALTVSAALATRPDLNRAKSEYDAYAILLREEHERFERELVVRRLTRMSAETRLWRIDNVDLREGMLGLEEGSVDLILVDPPYGTNLHLEKYAASTYHRYDDSPQAAMDLSIFIIQEGWRITRPKANLFLFCKGKYFDTLSKAAGQYGWQVWYEPLIWQKSKAEGEAPWGKLGFIHTYETILFATKGEKGIRGPTPDTFEFAKVGARARQHGAEKPVKLIEHIINLATIPGDLVLDPCLGSGTTTLAASRLNRKSIGMELDKIYYNRAMARMLHFEQGKSDEELVVDEGSSSDAE